MAGAKTIEVISVHIGKIRLKTRNGESRIVVFEEQRPGVGVGMVDNEEAEVLLGTPGLSGDFWKEGVELKEGAPSLPAGPMKAADLIELIKKAQTAEEVDALVGTDTRATVLSNADVRKAEIAEAADKKD